ncbi:MAG: DsbA family protein [Magnetospirillum sp.]|nr:DsbA family protein [Magnetospirillum sp.]
MIAKTFAAVFVVLGLGFAASPAIAQEDVPLTPKQVDGVRKIVRDYLMEHPEVIGEAIEALREKMRLQAEADAKKSIDAYKEELFNGKDDPVAGNPKGDVTLVEFFDYNCPFCKQSMEPLLDAVKADGKVKVVFKEFPILTDDSMVASRVALAAKKQGKYDEVYRAFMKYRGQLDEKAIWRLAAEAGVNVDQARKDAASPEIQKQIRRNQEIAHALDIGGTPTFIVGDHILSSALDQGGFKQLFESARKGTPQPQQ